MMPTETANFIRNVPVCHRCPLRRDGECGADSRHEAIGAKASAHACPKGYFPARGLGDVVKGVLDATGIGPATAAAIEKLTGRPCNCGKRAEALNDLVPLQP